MAVVNSDGHDSFYTGGGGGAPALRHGSQEALKAAIAREAIDLAPTGPGSWPTQRPASEETPRHAALRATFQAVSESLNGLIEECKTMPPSWETVVARANACIKLAEALETLKLSRPKS